VCSDAGNEYGRAGWLINNIIGNKKEETFKMSKKL
jgi:hypothetical protein